MDSRLVFCALTHFPEHTDRIRVNSLYSAAEPDDLVVAQEVASFYKMSFDDLPREQIPIQGRTLASAHWSYNLGSYYSYTPLTRGMRIPHAARLNGFYGEICARPYYARRMFGTELDLIPAEAFCEQYFARHRKSAISPSIESFDSLKKLFSDELSLIPGRSALEKLDNHYMFYRNGLHCSDRFRSQFSCPEFGPIQSKSLSLAKIMSYQVFSGAKVQYDIINLLNPALASLRYESKFDNEDRKGVYENLGILGEPWSEQLQLTPQSTENEWKAAGARIRTTNTITDPEEKNKLAERMRNFEDEHFNRAFGFVKELEQGGVIHLEELVRALWFMFSYPENTARSTRWNVLNRLASLHTQMCIVQRS